MIPKTLTATDFRKNLYQTLKNVAGGEPHLVTAQSGNVLLIAQAAYNDILYEREVLRAIAGVDNLERGKSASHRRVAAKARKQYRTRQRAKK